MAPLLQVNKITFFRAKGASSVQNCLGFSVIQIRLFLSYSSWFKVSSFEDMWMFNCLRIKVWVDVRGERAGENSTDWKVQTPFHKSQLQGDDISSPWIWQGLRCCGELSAICQQNFDALQDALKWVSDSSKVFQLCITCYRQKSTVGLENWFVKNIAIIANAVHLTSWL